MDPAGTADADRTAPFRPSYPQQILLLCSLGWFLAQSGRLVLPALALPIQETIAIGNAEFGFAISLMWAVYALLQFPGGIAGDDLGYKTVLVGSSVLAAFGFLVLAFTQTYALFLLATSLVGVGVGLFYITSRTFPSVLYGAKKGRALGVANAAGDAGGVLAPLGAAVIIGLAVAWQTGFVGFTAAFLLLAAGFHLTVDSAYRVDVPRVAAAASNAVAEFRKPGIPLTVAAYSVFAMTWQGSVAFIPLYMFETKGLSYELGGLMLSLFFLMGVIVKPAAGWLSDRIGRRILAVGSLFCAGCTLGTLALVVAGGWPVVALVGLFGATLMVFPPVTQAYLIDVFSTESVGSAFGLTRTVYVFVGSLGPTFVGVSSEVLSFDAAFATLAAGLVAGSLVLLFVVPPATAVADGD